MDPLILVALVVLALLVVGAMVRKLLGCAVKLALFVIVIAVVLWATGYMDVLF